MLELFCVDVDDGKKSSFIHKAKSYIFPIIVINIIVSLIEKKFNFLLVAAFCLGRGESLVGKKNLGLSCRESEEKRKEKKEILYTDKNEYNEL